MVTDLRLAADMPQLKSLTLMPHSKAYMAAAGIVDANLDALLGMKQLEVGSLAKLSQEHTLL